MPRRLPVLLATLAMAAGLVLAACASGPGSVSPEPSYPADAVRISAKDIQFSTTQLVVPAGKPFTLVFENKEGVPHNIAITTQPDGKGDVLFRHDPITATTGVFQVGPIPAGTYHFRCEIHPSMTGIILAQ